MIIFNHKKLKIRGGKTYITTKNTTEHFKGKKGILLQRGEAEVTLFETKTKSQRNSTK